MGGLVKTGHFDPEDTGCIQEMRTTGGLNRQNNYFDDQFNVSRKPFISALVKSEDLMLIFLLI